MVDFKLMEYFKQKLDTVTFKNMIFSTMTFERGSPCNGRVFLFSSSWIPSPSLAANVPSYMAQNRKGRETRSSKTFQISGPAQICGHSLTLSCTAVLKGHGWVTRSIRLRPNSNSCDFLLLPFFKVFEV
jgi:hypothetical protein